ncbi:hypothetical protein STEG23_018854 [Scotinomys teguina]
MQKPEDLEAETQRTSPETHRAVTRELLLHPSTPLRLPLDTLPPTSSLEKSDFIIKRIQSLKQVDVPWCFVSLLSPQSYEFRRHVDRKGLCNGAC